MGAFVKSVVKELKANNRGWVACYHEYDVPPPGEDDDFVYLASRVRIYLTRWVRSTKFGKKLGTFKRVVTEKIASIPRTISESCVAGRKRRFSGDPDESNRTANDDQRPETLPKRRKICVEAVQRRSRGDIAPDVSNNSNNSPVGATSTRPRFVEFTAMGDQDHVHGTEAVDDDVCHCPSNPEVLNGPRFVAGADSAPCGSSSSNTARENRIDVKSKPKPVDGNHDLHLAGSSRPEIPREVHQSNTQLGEPNEDLVDEGRTSQEVSAYSRPHVNPQISEFDLLQVQEQIEQHFHAPAEPAEQGIHFENEIWSAEDGGFVRIA